MQEMSKAGNQGISPNVVTYTSVISAWSNSKNRLGAERACAYLKHMKKLAAGGNVKCQPNKVTYNAVIRAWAQSSHPETASTVKWLKEEMSMLQR
jgi:Pentatricopeptide repeat domain